MGKRLGIGLLKGLFVGGLVGAGIQYGLHWTVDSGSLLAYLLAMGAAGTAGVFAGKAPWHEGAWIEALLKGMVGVGLGALVYWAAARYTTALVLPLPGSEAAPWTGLPVVFLPLITGTYAALVELDNVESTPKTTGKPGPKARVEIDSEGETKEIALRGAETRAGRRRDA